MALPTRDAMETRSGMVKKPSRPPNFSTGKKARPLPGKPYIPVITVLVLLLVSHTISALYAPILDCDETYNYWEPLHYLAHGHGMQTWEYSPEFAIRSWAYIGLHAVPVKLVSLFTISKRAQFYALRCLLGLVSADAEARLYAVISRSLNPRIAVLYFLVTLTSSGIFHASTAFLPSSFAMYCSTLGLNSFLTPAGPRGPFTASGIMFFGIGALLGWPFAGVLILPFVFEDWLTAFITDSLFPTFRRYLDGVVRCLIVLVLQISVDTFFYRQLVVVPLGLVLYNIFSGRDRGPNIFGVEPWHFYFRNLTLNFNLWFILAILSFPLLAIQAVFLGQRTTKQTLLRTTVILTPFYLWLAIFTLQPHKEERFMYPVYPFLALNAAIALHMLLTWLGQSTPGTLMGSIPPQVKLALVLPLVVGSVLLSVLRIAGTITAYSAPLTVYSHTPTTSKNYGSLASENICFGKDWYRFPTSFFLPSDPYHDTLHAQFVRSEFSGLLPGQFSSASGPGFFPAAHLIPPGMNDLNQFDPGKVIDVRHCEYLIDSYFSGLKATKLEPLYLQDTEHWERLHCEPFMDASSTGTIGRIMWIPDWKIVPERFRRKWGVHCLLRQRKK